MVGAYKIFEMINRILVIKIDIFYLVNCSEGFIINKAKD